MRFRPLLLLMLLAPPAAAQVTDTTQRAAGATVSGIVRDSIARTPLAGATVQLVVTDRVASFVRTAVSDSLGRFALGDVPPGRYTLGFFHPMLDSLGVAAPLRQVNVESWHSVRTDLAIPSPARIRAAICGPRPALDSGAVLVGVVRDARDGAPVAGATVTGEWLEYSFGKDGLVRRIPRLVATTGDNGWFAMCNVPSAGTMSVSARRGADTTDLIDVQVPAEGFVRREVYLGSARPVVIGDTMKRGDTLALAPRRVLLGEGRLNGTVVTVAGRKPLAGAQVSITDGPQTRANERGDWTLADAPTGTRMLDVRAVGYYPERRPVDVVAGAAPIHVALSTLKAVLDTVKISATRRVFYRDRNGFQRRQRTSGIGRFLTPEDIARRRPMETSDLFHMVAGVRMERGEGGFDNVILVRGAFGWCSPAIYIDGHHMRGFTADDVDLWVRPENVAGIEIYTGHRAPEEFQQAMSGCGSVVIWTK